MFEDREKAELIFENLEKAEGKHKEELKSKDDE